jgi:hypothetical protein
MDKGVYSCIVENKHGSNVANITMNILCESLFSLIVSLVFFIPSAALSLPQSSFASARLFP